MSAFELLLPARRIASRPRTWAVAGRLAVVVGMLVAGAAVSLVQPTVEGALIATIAIVGIAPLIVRRAMGTLDVFEPLVPATVAFVLLFSVRPIVDVTSSAREFAGQDLTNVYPTMLVVVLIGIAAFQLGYALFRRPPRDERGGHPQQPDTGVLLVVGGLLTLAAIFFLLLRALLAGGISTLFVDRSEIGTRAFTVPFISESVMLALPALLVLWSVPPPHRAAARVLALAPLAVLLTSAIPQGNRRDLLPALVAVTALAYLRRGARPRLLSLVVVGALAFFLLVTPLRVVRNGEAGYWSSVVTAIEHPLRSVESLFREQDTAMTTALAIEVRDVGSRIPFQHGRAALSETLLQPVPRQVWPEKPETIRMQLIELNWGLRNGSCATQCPTFSVLGSLYADGGLWTVALGGFAFGAVLARWYGYFRRRQGDPLIQAAYAATLFLPFYVWWSNLGALVLHFALLAAPLVIVARAARPGGRPT